MSDWLAEIKARLAAVEAEWARIKGPWLGDNVWRDAQTALVLAKEELLAHAPADLARCVAEIERLRAENESLRTVYLATYSNWDEYEVLGVFDSEIAAEQCNKRHQRSLYGHTYGTHQVEEMSVEHGEKSGAAPEEPEQKPAQHGFALVGTLFALGLIAVAAYLLAVASVRYDAAHAPAVQVPAVVRVYQAAQPVAQALIAGAQWEADLAAEIAEAEAAPASEYLLGYNVGGVNVTARPHAVQRHGESVYAARVAFGQNNPQRQRRECPESDRAINLTPVGDGTFAVMIEGLTSHRELTCWNVGSNPDEIARTWTRLLEMHKCKADAAQLRVAHDFFDTLPR